MSRRVVIVSICAAIVAAALGIGINASSGATEAPPTFPPFRTVNGQVDQNSLPATIHLVNPAGLSVGSMSRDEFVQRFIKPKLNPPQPPKGIS